MVSSQTPIRLFTIEEANAMLPLVRAITRDVMDLARGTAERQERLKALIAGRTVRDDIYSQELEHSERVLQQDAIRLRGFVHELQDLGVLVRDARLGIIDFPMARQDCVIHGCWKFGDPQLEAWHEADVPCGQRQPWLPSRSSQPSSNNSPLSFG